MSPASRGKVGKRESCLAPVGAFFVTLPASYSVRKVVVLLHEYLMASWSAVESHLSVPRPPKRRGFFFGNALLGRGGLAVCL